MASNKRLRLGFAGTPAFAAEHLNALINDAGHEIVAVWSQPDRPAGRGKQTQASPVKKLAQTHNIPVLQPQKLLSPNRQEMAELQLDILVVVAYGLILPQEVLDTPRLGCINVHASLLPRWRGAAPIQRAVEAGDAETGVCIMQMDAGLDTGDVISRTKFPIGDLDTAGSVHDRLIAEGAPLLIETINQMACRTVEPEAQRDQDSCYAAKIHKAEAEIDWQQPAEVLDRKIRAFNPVPVAYTNIGKDRIRLWQATLVKQTQPTGTAPGTILSASPDGLDVACGKGVLQLTNLQLPGKKAVAVADLLRGHGDKFAPGCRLGPTN